MSRGLWNDCHPPPTHTPQASRDASQRGSSAGRPPLQFLLVGVPEPRRASPLSPAEPGTPQGMESFLRKRLTFLASFWDKIWPAGAPPFPDPDADVEPEPAAGEAAASEPRSGPAPARLFTALYDFRARSAEELSVRRGDRLCALREEGGYVLARRLSGWPSTGLVPIAYVAEAAPESLSDQP